MPLARPCGCTTDRYCRDNVYTFSDSFSWSHSKYFWIADQGCLVYDHNTCTTTPTAHQEISAIWSKTNFRKMQCLSIQHFWNWKRKLEVSDLFPRSWVQSSSITGYTSAIIVLLEAVPVYLPSISIRFHFIWIMAQDGNRSGQRLFSYQTPKKSITQKERHLQITVQSIPHKC